MSQVKYIVHEDPVGRGASNHVVLVDLERFGFPGLFEQLWLDHDEEGSFTLACLPFRVYGLALGDLVAVNRDQTTIIELVRGSGHRLLRIFLSNALTSTEHEMMHEQLAQAVFARGALAEWSGDRHLAVDVPPGQSIDYIERIIAPHLRSESVYSEWADAESFK